ncbi:tubulin-tyrosine ligase/Tubulin polyglutamylase, partial [Ochromonadaceae sp. CCMP2298]
MHYLLCSLLQRGQAGINGACSSNMWIVKPAAKSRGRGISTFADLPKLLKYVDAGSGRYGGSQWVVQKYIENPLTIAKRKFDLRQWVVVTNWNPLTIYYYDECYARFGVDEYSTDAADLENSFVHLVNNSITKNSANFNKGFEAENGERVEGYMWDYAQFSKFVKHQSGSDLMDSKIRPRMKEIVTWSLMCASETIEHRKNSWELYGFDFMIDDAYNAWLIEINSSPACDYSTPVTERYVQKALVELLAVVLDTR